VRKGKEPEVWEHMNRDSANDVLIIKCDVWRRCIERLNKSLQDCRKTVFQTEKKKAGECNKKKEVENGKRKAGECGEKTVKR
jgi:hypothetical protein